MPKRAENLASGGNGSVLTTRGNRAALLKGRPASSFIPAGTSTWKVELSGKGPMKTRPVTKDGGVFSPSAFHRRPPGPTRATRCAWSQDTGAENWTVMGVTGMQPAWRFSRSQEKVAMNGPRVLKGRTWS